MDIMSQTVSKRVVSSVCGHSDGKTGRPRVFAVRDFPPGCGRVASRIFSGPNNEAVPAGAVDNSVCEEKRGAVNVEVKEDQSLRESQSLGSSIMHEQINHEKSKAEDPLVSSDVGMPLPESTEVLNDSRIVEPLEFLEVNAPKDVDKGDVPAPVQEVVPQKYPPRRRVSAVRHFPPFCGRNAPRLSEEELAKFLASRLSEGECTKVLASEENRSLDHGRSSIEDKQVKEIEIAHARQVEEDVRDGDIHKNGLEGNASSLTGKTVHPETDGPASKEMMNENEFGGYSEKEMVVAQGYSQGGFTDIRTLGDTTGKEHVVYTEKLPGSRNELLEEGLEEFFISRPVVQGLMAGPSCPWREGKGLHNSKSQFGSIGDRKAKKMLAKPPKSAFKMMNGIRNSGGMHMKTLSKKACQGVGQIVVWDKGHDPEGMEDSDSFQLVRRSRDISVVPPPLVFSSLNGKNDAGDVIVTRNIVRKTLSLFQTICRKLLHEEEAKPKEKRSNRRVDLSAAKLLKEQGKYVNEGKIIGSVPGVEVGDEFQYRVELNIIGLHRHIQGGIDFVRQGVNILATSVVSSGGYDDVTDNSDVLIYTGQGGNMMNGDKQPEDQKLERGNLALKNSITANNPVRVIRGDFKASDSSDSRVSRKYIYDGLYLVEKYWQETASHGKLVYKFKLVRIPGQPELAWKVVKKSKSKVREGLCVEDISQGKEMMRICAVNNIDNEKPQPFKYVTRMIYPNWYCPKPPEGCDCTNGCSEFGKCSCVAKNGGEIPYNHDGAIVEMKSMVYECGPSCKCPPSCYNRVSQHGIKFQLEIFKTESRGWGVRSLNSIPSGSFICEYAGELLEEKEAEQRTGNDEYLFDIGNNYSDSSHPDGLSILLTDGLSKSSGELDYSFTIDAAQYGNVGRFINHSCSPNLYAQDVLYDHDDKRLPHIMLFAAENIPPLQELTYHYNYKIDQVFDSHGNIKKKSCHCGSSECTGWMY